MKALLKATITLYYEVELDKPVADLLEAENEQFEQQLPKIDHSIFSSFPHRDRIEAKAKVRCLRPSQHEEENE